MEKTVLDEIRERTWSPYAIQKHVNKIFDYAQTQEDPEAYLRATMATILTGNISNRNIVRAYQFETKDKELEARVREIMFTAEREKGWKVNALV